MTARPRLPPQPLPFPFALEAGEWVLEGVPLGELAERFGTPLYVTSETRIRQNARRVRSAFAPRWPGYRLLYAVKANSNPAIVRVLREEGCGADCSSRIEIALGRALGIPADEMLYTAAYPAEDDLRFAVESGVSVNLDDPALLPRLLQHGTPPAVSFRLNPGPTDAGPEGLRFSGKDSKFGVSLSRALDGYREARRAGVEAFGVHTMPGSNVLHDRHFAAVGRFLGRAIQRVQAATGRAVAFADAGGGFGVPYRPGEEALDLDAVAEGLCGSLRAALGPTPTAQLWNEPGRYLVADSTVLLTRVSHVKAGAPPFVGVDAGMQTLLRPALYGAYHEVYPVAPRPGPRRRVHITGPVCENTDMLARSRNLPPLRVGDLLAIGQAGAYGFTMSSQYNTRPRPAEVLVGPHGARCIRRRESADDLLRGTGFSLPEVAA